MLNAGYGDLRKRVIILNFLRSDHVEYLFNMVPVPILMVSRNELQIVRLNAAAVSFLRYAEDENAANLINSFFDIEHKNFKAWKQCIQNNCMDIPEYVLLLKDQQKIVKIHTASVTFKGMSHVLLSLVDITTTHNQIKQLEQLAMMDDMTGLLNRRTFRVNLEMALQKLRAEDGIFFLAFMDLDDLKKVNDTYGHLEGDWYINTFTSLLLKTLRRTDIAGRIGGDEFAVIFSQCSVSYAEQSINRLQQQLKTISASVNKPFSMGVSTGLIMVDSRMEVGVDALLHIADEAMYNKKYCQSTKKDALLARAEKFGIKNNDSFW